MGLQIGDIHGLNTLTGVVRSIGTYLGSHNTVCSNSPQCIQLVIEVFDGMSGIILAITHSEADVKEKQIGV
jgi:hypothetical protein